MDSIISKIIEYYKNMAKVETISTHDLMPRDILSSEEIFSFYLGDADIIITDGVFVDLKKTSNIDIKEGFFSRKLKVNSKKFDLNVKNVMESLDALGINSEDYFIDYETDEYHAKFSNTKITATIININCKEIARVNYSNAISGEQTVDVRNIVEYDLENLFEIINGTTDFINIYDDKLKEEFEDYIEDAGTLENLYLFIERYFLDIEMHKENGRYILAYNTLLEAIIQNEYIRIKTGTYSDRYKENIDIINENYSDIIVNMIEKYKEQWWEILSWIL